MRWAKSTISWRVCGVATPRLSAFTSPAMGVRERSQIGELLTEIRRRAPDRVPRFLYLACCHGGDPVALNGDRRGLPATATALHRDGITQVVAYFGPVLDDLSTRAERAFYADLADGQR